MNISINKINFKAILIGFLVCLGTGYGMYQVTPSIISAMNGSTDISCSTITEEDWQKSPLHDQAKSLDEFKQLCMKYQHQISDVLPKQVTLFMSILPSIFVIGAFAMFRLHIKDNEIPSNREVKS